MDSRINGFRDLVRLSSTQWLSCVAYVISGFDVGWSEPACLKTANWTRSVHETLEEMKDLIPVPQLSFASLRICSPAFVSVVCLRDVFFYSDHSSLVHVLVPKSVSTFLDSLFFRPNQTLFKNIFVQSFTFLSSLLRLIVTTVNINCDIQSQGQHPSCLMPNLIVTPQDPEIKGVLSMTWFNTIPLNPLSYPSSIPQREAPYHCTCIRKSDWIHLPFLQVTPW